MNGQLYYFTIPVGDLARAKAFFGELLGWEFGSDGGHITNSDPPGGVNADAAGMPPRLYFHTDDVAATVARVRALGGEAQGVQEGPSGWWADCTDDQGTRFCVGRLREGVS